MAGLLALAIFGGASPARGQITSYVDEEGKRVFVNAETLPQRRTAGRATLGRASRPEQPTLRLVSYRPTAPRGLPAQNASYTKEGLEQIAQEAAERHQLDPALIRAVIEAESNWDPEAVSRKGALGLMQLMPATATELGVNDAFDPVQNLDGGVRHLRAMLERYQGDLDRALAAYNAGGGAVDRAGGVPNYVETRSYVQKITDNYFRPGSGRSTSWWQVPRPIYQAVNERGRRVFTNE